ncbi:MAG TPA: ROK family protein [Verrucomicrobiae bacterium]|nr:ROK family protein [Verrucomicrobiae bacterium]
MSKTAVLGIDIGGTKTLCVLVDKHFKILKTHKFKTASDEGQKRFATNLANAVGALRGHALAEGYNFKGIGVGFAGALDSKSGVVQSSPNLLCLEGFHLKRFLQKEFKTPVSIGNDVQTGIMGEFKLGAARGCKNVLGVFFGTGVGGAAIVNGKLYTGASGFGGQVGNILAQPVGGPKAALSHGIVDRIASKSAITTEALVMAIKEWAPYLHRKVGTDLSKVTWGMLRKAIEHKDSRIEEMVRARLRVVGIALASVVNFFNPEVLVVGGGLVSEVRKLAMEEVEGGLREYLVPEVSEALDVRPASLGSESVAIGAAYAALETNGHL